MTSKYSGDSLLPEMERMKVTPRDWKPSHISKHDETLKGRQSFEENTPPTEKRGWSTAQRYQSDLKRYSQPPTGEELDIGKTKSEGEMEIIRPDNTEFLDPKAYERKW